MGWHSPKTGTSGPRWCLSWTWGPVGSARVKWGTCGSRRRQGVVLLLFHELQGHGTEVALVLHDEVTQGYHQLLPEGQGQERPAQACRRPREPRTRAAEQPRLRRQLGYGTALRQCRARPGLCPCSTVGLAGPAHRSSQGSRAPWEAPVLPVRA